MTNKQSKYSHIFTKAQQEEMMAFAREQGNESQTVTKLREKFGIPRTQAYFYRCKAFGYRRGQRLPVVVMVSAEVNDLLQTAVDNGSAESRRHAAEWAIQKFCKGGNK